MKFEASKNRNVPPISRLIEADIPDPHIFAINKPYQTRAALIAGARASAIPAHHHILPLIESRHELQTLAVDLPAACDPHVRRILRQHDVPLLLLLRVVLQPGAAEDGGVPGYVQHDAGFQVQRRRQVISRREVDLAGAAMAGGG